MASIINTNINSITAQRNLAMTQSSLSTSMQRLSSGLRINSAKDDAAGLAISERFTTQIRGLNQASRNANDGISLAQTAEGALAEITSNLQRIRELAVQSVNATNSATDRAALDQEVQQRLAEVQRVASQTTFNGQKILDGSFGTAVFQVGANVGETIGVGLGTSMKTSDIGSFVNVKSDVTAAAFGNLEGVETGTALGTTNAYQTGAATYTGVDQNVPTAGAVRINGTSINAASSYAVTGDTNRAGDSAYAKAAAINGSGVAGVTATATTTKTFSDTPVGDNMFMDMDALGTGDTLAYSLSINGQAVFTAASVNADGITMDAAVTAINSVSSASGVVATKDINNQLILTAADGRNISISETTTFTDAAGGAGDSSGDVNTVFSTQTITDDGGTADANGAVTNAITVRGDISLQSSASITINTGNAAIGFSTGNYAASSSLGAQNVLTVAGANNALNSMDSALTAVSTLRSGFGAIQNRFESVISTLSTTSENLSSSRSRVQDADFAQETANLSRAQILQQAGTAMVAQANQLPQGVLALLR